MQAVHKTLLEVNEEFLVSEAPVTPLIQALHDRHVLTDLDLQQLSSLELQGSRAVKRFVLHVLPHRGPLAFPALLESLQEARAQHLVDLLLEEEAVLNAAVKPFVLPERDPPQPAEDPNEYARKLRANMELIENAVDPQHVIPAMLQNGVLSELEERLLAEVKGQHALTWSVLWGVLMQRGARANNAFMGALLQRGYNALFHTIQETKVTGPEALTSTLTRNTTTAASNNKHRVADHDKRLNLASPPGYSHSPDVRGRRDTAALDPPPGFVSPRDGGGPLATSSPSPHVSPLKPVFSQRGPGEGVRSEGGASGSSFRPLATSSPSPHVSPLKPVFSQRGPGEGVRSGGGASGSSSRPFAGPLHPGYSLGDLDFQYTPRSERLVSDSGSGAQRGSFHVPRPVDSLYSPTWADPYNHLRAADVGSSRLMHRSYAPGDELDGGFTRPLDPGFPSKHASVDLSSSDKDSNGVNGRSTSPVFEAELAKGSQMLEFGRMNTIPEQDADSDTTNPTDVEESPKSPRRQRDQQAGDNRTPRITQQSPGHDLHGSRSRSSPPPPPRHSAETSYSKESSRDPSNHKTGTVPKHQDSGGSNSADAPREATPTSKTSAKQHQGSETPGSPVNNHVDSRPAADELADSAKRNTSGDHDKGTEKKKDRTQKVETKHDSKTSESDKYGEYRSNSF